MYRTLVENITIATSIIGIMLLITAFVIRKDNTITKERILEELDNINK